jgi:hypothetical protein
VVVGALRGAGGAGPRWHVPLLAATDGRELPGIYVTAVVVGVAVAVYCISCTHALLPREHNTICDITGEPAPPPPPPFPGLRHGGREELAGRP